MASWDPAKHPHGVHGHWAGVGGRHRTVNRVAVERKPEARGTAAFRSHRTESAARRRYARITGAARAVDEAWTQQRRGERVKHPSLIFHPNGASKNAFDAKQDATHGLRGTGGTQRLSTKRVGGGKAVVARGLKSYTTDDGWQRGYGKKLRTQNLAGKKGSSGRTTARHLMKENR